MKVASMRYTRGILAAIYAHYFKNGWFALGKIACLVLLQQFDGARKLGENFDF